MLGEGRLRGAVHFLFVRRLGLAVLRHDRLDTAQVSSGAQYCYIRALDEMEGLTGVTIFTGSFTTLPQGADEILGDVLTYGTYDEVDSARRQLDQGKDLAPSSWMSAIWSVQRTDEIHRF